MCEFICTDVSNHISDISLFLACRAITQLENALSREYGGPYFIFDAAPTATKHQPHMLRCLALQLVPHGGNDPHAFRDPLKPTLTFEMIRRHTLSDPLTDTLR